MKTPTATPPRMNRKRLLRRALGTAAAAALAWLVATGAPFGSGATPSAAPVTAPIADEAPGYAVEDFNYPQADKILAEQGITLKRGDGHITLADCVSGTGQLEVLARDKSKICFQVTGNSGWLTLEFPSVYTIKGNDYTTQVDMTTGTEKQSFDIAKNTWTPVGESVDPSGREFTLVEIRTSK
jgi:hypothetical protein